MPSVRTAPWTCDSKVGRQPHQSRHSSVPGDGIFRSLLTVISHTGQVSARAPTRNVLGAGRTDQRLTLIFRRLQLMQLDGCRRLFPLVLMVGTPGLESAQATSGVKLGVQDSATSRGKIQYVYTTDIRQIYLRLFLNLHTKLPLAYAR